MSALRIAILLAACIGLGTTSAAAQPDPSLVTQGQYLTAMGDCAACHTAPGGKPFVGGLPMASPIGSIYTTNITPDKTNGIGTWSEADFAKLLRKGITKKGYVLYPAMPFPSYARLTDGDVKAMYAYFMLGVQPVDQVNHAEGIPWPLSIRWPLHIWRWAFAPPARPFEAAAGQSPEVARGAYLVEGLGHCGACHTPRAITLQEKALTDRGGAVFLSGGSLVDGWTPPNLRGDNITGLGTWSQDDIVSFLKYGADTKEAAFGGMTDVVHNSMQYANDADLHAIAAYLKTLSPIDPTNPAFVYNDTESQKLMHGDASAVGALVYINNCAACHRTDGKGYTGAFPALAGNPVVLNADPSSLVHIVLSGAKRPETFAAPSALVMPSLAWKLSDQQVADVVTFIRASWGNNAGAVGPNAVARPAAAPAASRRGIATGVV